MEQRHKDLLRGNNSTLVRDMVSVSSVMGHLMDTRTLNEIMIEDIEANPTKTGKNSALLMLLPKRGPNALYEFYKALISTDNDVIADLLEPGLTRDQIAAVPRNASSTPHLVTEKPHKQIHRQESSKLDLDMPAEWPNEESRQITVSITKCDFDIEELRTRLKTNTNTIYSLKRKFRGLAVIIDNQKFSKNTNLRFRNGSQQDSTKLDILFREFGFHTRQKPNLTATEIRTYLSEIAASEKHQHADCFVLFILSHGSMDNIYGTDGESVEIKEVKSFFNGQNCRGLINKPKLIFLQACQGESKDEGVEVSDAKPDKPLPNELSTKLQNMDVSEKQSDGNVPSPIGGKGDTIDAAKVDVLPTMSDMFVAYATTDGFVSFRNENYGAWFIQAIIYSFSHWAHSLNLSQLMTRVNKLVSMARTSRGHMQASRHDSTLTKELFFFPGLSDDGPQEASS